MPSTRMSWCEGRMNIELRTMTTAAETALADNFAAAKSGLPGSSSIASLREEAFQRFEVRGLPHRRVEDWKYTDLRALMREALPLAGPPDAQTKAAAERSGAELSPID